MNSWLAVVYLSVASAPPCVLGLVASPEDAAVTQAAGKWFASSHVTAAPAPMCGRGDARCVLAQMDAQKCASAIHVGRSRYPGVDGGRPFVDAYDASGRFHREVCRHDAAPDKALTTCLANSTGAMSLRNRTAGTGNSFAQVLFLDDGKSTVSGLSVDADGLRWRADKEAAMHLAPGAFTFRLPTLADDARFRKVFPRQNGLLTTEDWLVVEASGPKGMRVYARLADEAERDALVDALAALSAPAP